MKIVSWNCKGNFREKYKAIQLLDADIYVIQESENPRKYIEEFEGFFTNYIWFGEDQNRGLAVFAKPDIKLLQLNWPSYGLRYFVPIEVNNDFILLAVWTSKSSYIEGYYVYQSINIDKFKENIVIIGDFNSNVKWDKDHGIRNHSAVIRDLKELGILSAYHYITRDVEGKEKQPTFYQSRKNGKNIFNHIDYCFTRAENIKDFKVFDLSDWIKYKTDHAPIQIII